MAALGVVASERLTAPAGGRWLAHIETTNYYDRLSATAADGQVVTLASQRWPSITAIDVPAGLAAGTRLQFEGRALQVGPPLAPPVVALAPRRVRGDRCAWLCEPQAQAPTLRCGDWEVLTLEAPRAQAGQLLLDSAWAELPQDLQGGPQLVGPALLTDLSAFDGGDATTMRLAIPAGPPSDKQLLAVIEDADDGSRYDTRWLK